MAEVTIAHPGKETTTEPTPAYVLRGLGLVELFKDQILDSYLGGGRWIVPSGTEPGKSYEVRVGSRPERHRCECRGFSSHRHCSHLIAAQRATWLSGICDCCGTRCWWPQLQEVTEDDGLLAWFPGDVLCSSCVPGHWA